MSTRKTYLLNYLVTITLSSFLLFSIQPLAAKALLPVFGGAPAVWNTCMVFFQGSLLLGYFYAYLSTRFLSRFLQALVHFSILGLSILMLPILWTELYPLGKLHPSFSVLLLLLHKIGLPLFIVSATAPLVQTWFGQTTHPDAKDPYFLYSASNLGSLLALLGFPFLLEPFIGRQNLSLLWSLGYCIFALLLVLIALSQPTPKQTLIPLTKKEKTTWKQRSSWLLLSFAPSSLLLAVTQYISTNLAATPLLWILPLTLYLLTFIIAFARKPLISHSWMVREAGYFLVFPLLSLTQMTHALPAWQLIFFHLLGFFALALVCHGELASKRPDKAQLTEFYLWLALGGFLGGIFTSMLAPLIFKGSYEYYFAFCLCILLCPSTTFKPKAEKSTWLLPLVLAVTLAANYFLNKNFPESELAKGLGVFIELAVITAMITWHQRPRLFALNVALLFFYIQASAWSSMGDLIWQSRNFFGVSRVYNNEKMHLHIYINGVTLHGAQVFSAASKPEEAFTYYRPIYNLAPFLVYEKKEKGPSPIAIIGLGTGTLSCPFQKEAVTFFEINPTVIKIAQTPSLFTYLKNCPPQGGIILGDARYKLAQAPDHYYKLIILDAFSSDAIPTHLLTLEALKIYLQKLTPQGILLLHISNTYADLKPLVAGLAKQLQLTALQYEQTGNARFDLASIWVILTKNENLAETLQTIAPWEKLSTAKAPLVWTDDYSNILKVLK